MEHCSLSAMQNTPVRSNESSLTLLWINFQLSLGQVSTGLHWSSFSNIFWKWSFLAKAPQVIQRLVSCFAMLWSLPSIIHTSYAEAKPDGKSSSKLPESYSGIYCFCFLFQLEYPRTTARGRSLKRDVDWTKWSWWTLPDTAGCGSANASSEILVSWAVQRTYWLTWIHTAPARENVQLLFRIKLSGIWDPVQS